LGDGEAFGFTANPKVTIAIHSPSVIYVFPRGELTNLSQVLKELAQAKCETGDVEDLRPRYA